MFASAVPASPRAYPTYDGTASTEARARSYLHANCAGCHRPSGGARRSTMDVRFATPFGSTNTCNTPPLSDDDFGSTVNRLIKPGATIASIVSLRMHTLDGRRLPPLGSSRVDAQGIGIIDSWVASLAGCP